VLAQSLSGVSGLTEETAEQMRFRCVSKLKPSSRSFKSYEEVVTDFYERYSEDESIESQDILQLLLYDSDGKLSAADIHKLIKVGGRP